MREVRGRLTRVANVIGSDLPFFGSTELEYPRTLQRVEVPIVDQELGSLLETVQGAEVEAEHHGLEAGHFLVLDGPERGIILLAEIAEDFVRREFGRLGLAG